MAAARRIARNTALQLGGNTAALAASVASLPILVRYLGVDGYGTYSVATAGFALLVAGAGSGLDAIAVRTFAADGVDALLFRRLLGLRVAVAGAAASVAVALVWSLPSGRGLRLAVTVLGVAALIAAFQAAFAAVLQARQAFGAPVLADLGCRLGAVAGYAALGLFVAPWPHDRALRVALVLAASVAAAGVTTTATAWYVRRHTTAVRPAFDAPTWSLFARRAAPLGLATVLGIANYRLDIVVLAALKGPHAAGIYGLAYRFVDASLPLAVFFVGAAFPAFSRTLADGGFRSSHAQRSLDFLLLASLPLCLGGVAVAPQLVQLFGGADYAGAALPLRLLLLSLPFTFVSMFLVSLAVASDRQSRVALLTGAAVVANLALNLALVPRFSASGSAAATLATEVAGTVALLALARRWFELRLAFGAGARAAAAAATAAVAAAIAVRYGVAAAAAAGVVVYAAGAIVFGAVTVPDLRVLAGRAS